MLVKNNAPIRQTDDSFSRSPSRYVCLKVQTRITEKEGNKTNCVSTTGANFDYLTNFRKIISFSADFAIFAGELADLLKDIAPGFGDSL